VPVRHRRPQPSGRVHEPSERAVIAGEAQDGSPDFALLRLWP
jgi:hypothetical protein